MILEQYITEWSQQASWRSSKFIEQNLIVCNALVPIYSDTILVEHLVFRSCTALSRLSLKPQLKYSEDIDLVQVKANPIKKAISHLRNALAWLGKVMAKQKRHNNTLVSKVQPTDMDAEEINCKEYFSVFRKVRVPFAVNSSWFKDTCEVLTYKLSELAGTKLKAVYQPKKGRELFDLWKTISIYHELDKGKVTEIYKRYLGFTVSHPLTYMKFVLNRTGSYILDGHGNNAWATDGVYSSDVAWEKMKVELNERLNTEV